MATPAKITQIGIVWQRLGQHNAMFSWHSLVWPALIYRNRHF